MPILFIVAGYGKLGRLCRYPDYMAAMGVLSFLLPLTISLEISGGLAVLYGLLTQAWRLLP